MMRARTRPRLLRALSSTFAAYILSSCSGPPADERFATNAPPPETFPPVGEVLGSHCGSLDCHGHRARNLRVYSGNGLRLSEVSGGATTPEEYDATYRSVVAIDPETFNAVVAAQGAGADHWIVLSKGRGTEAHKGGTALATGTDGDRCVVSWLSGPVDIAACTAAAEFLPPEAP